MTIDQNATAPKRPSLMQAVMNWVECRLLKFEVDIRDAFATWFENEAVPDLARQHEEWRAEFVANELQQLIADEVERQLSQRVSEELDLRIAQKKADTLERLKREHRAHQQRAH